MTQQQKAGSPIASAPLTPPIEEKQFRRLARNCGYTQIVMRYPTAMKSMIFTFLLIISSLAYSQGYTVTLSTISGDTFTGELIYVRDNALLVYQGTVPRNYSVESYVSSIKSFEFSSLSQVSVQGRSYVFQGLLVGALAPATLVYFGSDNREDYINYGLAVTAVFSSLGGIVGGFVGKWSSIKPVNISTFDNNALQILRNRSRLKGSEPHYLEVVR